MGLAGLLKRYILPPFETCCFFNTKIKLETAIYKLQCSGAKCIRIPVQLTFHGRRRIALQLGFPRVSASATAAETPAPDLGDQSHGHRQTPEVLRGPRPRFFESSPKEAELQPWKLGRRVTPAIWAWLKTGGAHRRCWPFHLPGFHVGAGCLSSHLVCWQEGGIVGEHGQPRQAVPRGFENPKGCQPLTSCNLEQCNLVMKDKTPNILYIYTYIYIYTHTHVHSPNVSDKYMYVSCMLHQHMTW